jgi:hypothetical protein
MAIRRRTRDVMLAASVAVPAVLGVLAGCNSSSSAPQCVGAAGIPCAVTPGEDASGGDGGFISEFDATMGTDSGAAVGRDGGADAVDDSTVADAASASDAAASDAPAEAAPTDAGLAPDVDPACADYADTPGTSGVSIRITNNTGSNIFVGRTAPSCAFDIGFTLTDGDAGADAGGYTVATDNCQYSCGTRQQICACAPYCDPGRVTLVAPGKYWEIGWTSTVFTTQRMPAYCYVDAGCAPQATCEQEGPLAPGTYTVSASVGTMAVCEGGGCPYDCTPGAFNAGCTEQGASTIGGTILTGTATWTPGQSIVVIPIQ